MSRQGWPEKRKVGQYPIDYDYRAEGFNEALSLCLAAAAKEKAELIGKILSEKDIEKILLSQFNIEIIEADFNALINQKPPTTATEAVSFEYRKRAGRIKLKEMSNMIHSELMKRLKNE